MFWVSPWIPCLSNVLNQSLWLLHNLASNYVVFVCVCLHGCFVSGTGVVGCLVVSYSTGGTSVGLKSSGVMSVSCWTCSSSIGFVGTKVVLFLRSVRRSKTNATILTMLLVFLVKKGLVKQQCRWKLVRIPFGRVSKLSLLPLVWVTL